MARSVVICFQFWVSLTSLSLHHNYHLVEHELWFAFNFGYLWHRYHCVGWSQMMRRELWFAFNFGYLWHRYHFKSMHTKYHRVVICFQFWVSLTSLSLGLGYPYCYFSCDLLSILGIFDIAITCTSSLHPVCIVVICFQFWVSLTSLSLQWQWLGWAF